MGGDDPRRPGDGPDDDGLDEALEESFPASDPPAGNGSVMPPGQPIPTDSDDKES